MVWPLKAKLDRHLTGHQIDQRRRNEKRRNPARPTLFEQDSRLRDGGQTTDARSDHHTGPAFGFLIGRNIATVGHSLRRRRHSIQNKIINLAPLFWSHPVVRIKCPIRAVTKGNFARVGRGQMAGVKPLNGARARFPRKDPRPGLFDTARQWGYHPQAGHNNSPHVCPLIGRLSAYLHRPARTLKGTNCGHPHKAAHRHRRLLCSPNTHPNRTNKNGAPIGAPFTAK